MMSLRRALSYYHRNSLKSFNLLPAFWNRHKVEGSTMISLAMTTTGCLSCFCFLFHEVDDDDIDYKLKDLRSCSSNFCSINHFKTIKKTMTTTITPTTVMPLASIYKTHCSQQQQQYQQQQQQDLSHQPRKVEIRRLFSTTMSPPPSLSSSTQQQQHTITTTILHNQIIIIQQVLTPNECHILQNEADRLINNPEGGYSRDRIVVTNDDADDADDDDNEEDNDNDNDDNSLRRISIEDMSPIAQDISQQLIRERILPLLSKQRITINNNDDDDNTTSSDCNKTNHHHQQQQDSTEEEEEEEDLLTNLCLQDFKSTNAIWEWASDEPTVNVYNKGGKFEPHRDGYALTVVVLLNNPNQFKGGGTEFYNTNNNKNKKKKNLEKSVVLDDKEEDDVSSNNHHHQQQSSSLLPPLIDSSSSFSSDDDDDGGDGSNLDTTANIVIIQPKECGTAICFDGDMMHAGSPVIDGKRYVYVASFGIVCGSGIED